VVVKAHRRLVPAVIVPDIGAWAMWGRDLRALGFRAASAPQHAELMIAPARVPQALDEAISAAWARMPPPRRHVALGDELADGAQLAVVLAEVRHGHEPDPGEGDHGDMDDGDMMAITGEPSADGLVMEAADVELGPLSSPLPGGLVVNASLDGDVVATCKVRALLRASASSHALDPLTPAAWSAAHAIARGESGGWGPRLAAVEVERALSHLVWLGRMSAVLGWPQLTTQTQQAVSAVLAVKRGLPAAARPAQRVAELLDGSRRLGSRTRGVAVVGAKEAARRGLGGPDARASGLVVDARAGEPCYAAAGFEVVVAQDGDAQARVLVRAREAVQALRLADRLCDEDPPAPARIEGPRGCVRVSPAPGGRGRVRHQAPDPTAAFAVCAELAVGLPWSRALVALASFDLSPWRVES